MREDRNAEGRNKPVILLVDDSPDSITVMRAILKDHYKVKVATSGERALEIASAAEGPNLILLDVVMPDMDGYETCRRLKELPETAGIPVIFLSARADARAEERGLALGAVDFITKPPSPPIVLARIRAHLPESGSEVHA